MLKVNQQGKEPDVGYVTSQIDSTFQPQTESIQIRLTDINLGEFWSFFDVGDRVCLQNIGF
jgi:hypothetical protein